MEFADIFNQFAFPAACCIMEGYIILKIYQGSREDLKARDDQIQLLNEQHAAETAKWAGIVTDALNKNTVAIERLSTMLGAREEPGT